MTVEMSIEDPRWSGADLERLAGVAVVATLRHLGLEPDAWEVSIMGCSDARIAALNSDFRDKPTATNVLSWPSEERGSKVEGGVPSAPVGTGELGDIALAFETCEREAAERNIPFKHHILHLIVHGVLHLLGYDHVRDGDGDLMESAEIAILEELGVPDPYECPI